MCTLRRVLYNALVEAAVLLPGLQNARATFGNGSDMENRIVCTVIGDAMIDIIIPLSGLEDIRNLTEGGVANTEMMVSPGGAANVAVHIADLGGNSAFVGKVGDDYFGRVFIEGLEGKNVVCRAPTASKRTGVVVSLVLAGGERFFIVDRGANAELSFDDIDMDLILSSDAIYLTGYSFQDEKTSQTIRRILELVPERVTVVFNPGAPRLAEELRLDFLDLIEKHAGAVVLNKREGEYLTECTKESEMVNHLLGLTRVVALTKGHEGSTVATRNEIHGFVALDMPVTDTTGAGDAYAAGLIYGLSKGLGVAGAGKLATKLAAEVVSRFGARI